MDTFCINLDRLESNPIYKNFLRLCDIHDGLRYRIASWCELSSPKIVRGEPFLSDLKPGWPEWMIKTIALDSAAGKNFKFETFLADDGITKYYTGVWNRRFAIRDDPNDLKRYQEWLDNGGDDLFLQSNTVASCDSPIICNHGDEKDCNISDANNQIRRPRVDNDEDGVER